MTQRTALPEPLRNRPFTVRHARTEGVAEHRIRAKDLDRPFHGVRRHGVAVGLVERCADYAEWMHPTAFFCSLTAAELHGLPVPDRGKDLHVASVAPRRAPEGVGVVGHKLRALPGDVVLMNGMRVSSLERAWCEMASGVGLRQLVRAGDRALWFRDPLSTLEKLTSAVEHHPGRRGKANLDRALPLLSSRAASPPESDLRVILTEGGITGLSPNHEVRIGSRLAFIDIAIPRYRIAIEYQGDYHRDAEQWRLDRMRRAALEAQGWIVIELTAADLRDEAALCAMIWQFIRGAANR